MRTTCFAALSFVVLVATPTIRADERDDALKIIDRGIKAVGDEAIQTKMKASTYKMKGTFHGQGVPIQYTGEAQIQSPDKSRMMLEFDADGQKFMFEMAFAGDKGWMKVNDQVVEMEADRVAEQKESMHLHEVARLVGLKDKAYTLSPLGESKVEDKPAVGVKVSSKDRRDVNLYFDKESGLLVKSEMQVKDDAGEEKKQESVYKDYKTADGIKHPTKVTIKRDGMLYIEGENSDWKSAEKLDDKLFVQPKE